MSLKGEVVKEYLTQFPDVPTRTLANMIYNENRALFTDAENVRDTIRYYRGAKGDGFRKTVSDKRFIGFEGEPNPFDALPEGMTAFSEWEPYFIEGENILAISDVHAPYHNKSALKVALNRGKDLQVDTILILGDFLDFYSLSWFEKDPRRRDFSAELTVCREILDVIRQEFPDIEIVYKIGNHEERFERYMKVKAPELLGVKAFRIENLLDAEYFKLTMVGDKRIIKVGKYLNCIHGHEFGRSISSPVNPARGLYLKGKEIAICGHHHQSSHHAEKSMTDSHVSCWSLGCLCDLRPEYLPINKWNHGFAEIQRNGDKFRLTNHRIIDGKIY